MQKEKNGFFSKFRSEKIQRISKILSIVFLSIFCVGAIGSIFGASGGFNDSLKLLPTSNYVTKVDIDENSFAKVHFLGDDVDFSKLRLNVSYKDGTVRNVGINDGNASLKQEDDVSTPGRKKLTVSYAGSKREYYFYVANKDGANVITWDNKTAQYYTDASSLNLFKSDNIIPDEYIERLKDFSCVYNCTLESMNNGVVKIINDGTNEKAFSVEIYDGAPLVSNDQKIRISLLADGSNASLYFKINFWNVYGTSKSKQITLNPGKSIDIDLSTMPDVTFWDFDLRISQDGVVNSSFYFQIEVIDEITNDGVYYNTSLSSTNYIPPKDVRVITPDQFGIFKLTYGPDAYIKVYAPTGKKIYSIK